MFAMLKHTVRFLRVISIIVALAMPQFVLKGVFWIIFGFFSCDWVGWVFISGVFLYKNFDSIEDYMEKIFQIISFFFFELLYILLCLNPSNSLIFRDLGLVAIPGDTLYFFNLLQHLLIQNIGIMSAILADFLMTGNVQITIIVSFGVTALDFLLTFIQITLILYESILFRRRVREQVDMRDHFWDEEIRPKELLIGIIND